MATFEPLRWFRVPGRAWLVVMLSASLLAGYGLQALLNITGKWHGEDDDPPKYFFWLRLLAAASAGIFAICGATMLTTTMLELTPSTAALMLFNGVALGVVLLVVLLQRGREPIVATSLLLITFADVAVTGAQWLEWRGYDDWLEPHAELAEALRDFPAARIYSPDYALPQPVAEVYGLQLFYGVDPFQLQGMVQAIETASGVPVDGYSIVLPPLTGIEGMDEILQVNRSYTPNPRILAAWGVSHIISGYEYDLPSLTPLETIDGIHIYLNQAYIQLDADEAAAQDALSLLPTPDEIEVLHRRTLAAVWVSAASFVFVGGGIAYLSVRKAGNSEE